MTRSKKTGGSTGATTEQWLKSQIDALQTEVDDLRTKLRKKFSADRLENLNSKSNDLGDLKKRLKRERQLKKRSLERFITNSLGSEADHEELWESTLRADAIRDEMRTGDDLEKIKSHPIYRSGI